MSKKRHHLHTWVAESYNWQNNRCVPFTTQLTNRSNRKHWELSKKIVGLKEVNVLLKWWSIVPCLIWKSFRQFEFLSFRLLLSFVYFSRSLHHCTLATRSSTQIQKFRQSSSFEGVPIEHETITCSWPLPVFLSLGLFFQQARILSVWGHEGNHETNETSWHRLPSDNVEFGNCVPDWLCGVNPGVSVQVAAKVVVMSQLPWSCFCKHYYKTGNRIRKLKFKSHLQQLPPDSWFRRYFHEEGSIKKFGQP